MDERCSLLFPDDVTPLWRIVYSIMIGWLNKVVACDWLAELSVPDVQNVFSLSLTIIENCILSSDWLAELSVPDVQNVFSLSLTIIENCILSYDWMAEQSSGL